MAGKDYYLVLGVSRGESPGGVRRAFHDLALRHHPDRAGPSSTPMFREVVEAYGVLSNPQRRREHDAQLAAAERSSTRAQRVMERRSPRTTRTPDLFSQPDSILPGADALLERILRNFVGAGMGKSERVEPLLCDIALSAEEAREGGVLPIRIPVAEPCPACHGTGRIAVFPCGSCDASGRAAAELTVPLAIPAGLRSGTVLETSMERWGIRNLWLRARVRVED